MLLSPYDEPGPRRAPRAHLLAAWIIMAVLLIATIVYRLLPALFAGLLVYELVHRITPRLRMISAESAKVAAVAIIAAVVVGSLLSLFFGLTAFLTGDGSGYEALLDKVAQIVEQSRHLLPTWLSMEQPMDADGVKSGAASWLHANAGAVGAAGRDTVETIVHIIVGMVIGALVSLLDVLPDREHGPLSIALIGRVRHLSAVFGRVVFAQVRIAALNTALTALYVLVALPLLGIQLPFGKTIVAITFIAGLLPVIGNLLSNAIIVAVSIGISLRLGIASLVFLIVVHKLEYFLNARIVGRRIGASAWELLLAMMAMQAIFGLPGLVAAPVYYAYLKDELVAAGQV
jgi:predicted PurR-regulated permease PerM